MPIRQITIIGTGLIGGSFGLALKKSGFSGRIVGCDRAPVLEQALKIGTIDSAQTDPIEAVRGSQLILLAAPVGAIIELIGRLGPALPPDALLTDTGGTKREIMAQAAKVFGAASASDSSVGIRWQEKSDLGWKWPHLIFSREQPGLWPRLLAKRWMKA